MIDLKQTQKSISDSRKLKLRLAKTISADKTKLKSVTQKISDNKRNNKTDSKLDIQQSELQSSIDDNQTTFVELDDDLNDKLKEITQYSPRELVEQLSDNYPSLLLPVKIETRFKTFDNSKELWVRIFPDDIAINTHEESLTEAEYESGRNYWLTIFNVTDDAVKQGAWNTLVSAYDANRSAWIIKQTKPPNWDDNPAGVDALSFPVYSEFKTASWTEAPHIKVMPDCFVVTGYSGGQVVFEKTGNLIPNDLQIALDPSSDAVLQRDTASGEIILTEKLSWVFDFTKAEEAGMAMRVPLEEPYATEGLDRIVVLGLRLSSDEKEGSELIEGLIDNHHYSANGFSFVRQGTPTNNTEDDSSAYSSTDFANETSYEVETGEALFTVSTNDLDKSDAQRFAEALGIRYEPLYHITYANLTDVSEAKLMNTALWPGTLGYFMSDMMAPLFSGEQINFVRDYFTAYVTGRGPLPTIRVGTQPYGVLPTTSFSTWKSTDNETGEYYTYYNNLYSILSKLQETWDTLLSKVSYYGMTGDAYAALLDIIGLQASSVEFCQRIGTDDGYTWAYLCLQNYGAAALWWPAFLKVSDDILIAVGLDPANRPKIADVGFFNSQIKLTGDLIDENPLSETDELSTYDGTNNYIGWLLASDSDSIKDETFKDANGTTVAPPTALLYLMLRNSYLQQVWLNVEMLYQQYNLITSPVKDQSILNVKSQAEMTKMDYMMADVTKIFPAAITAGVSTSAANLVRQSSIISLLGDKYASSVTNALGKLKDLPTARLERIFTEHLDLCSYRLDAWQTGMFTKRLEYLRTQSGQTGDESSTQKGIYIGAFGWLEDIKPDTTSFRQVSIEEIPDKLRETDKGKIYEDPGNGGYIHGFSLNHALTGAVLRSAYLSHADDSNADVMSVNLSSERVRTALYYLDGIRNGQTLSSLLGYQFERGLHDNNPTLTLDEYIYDFRDKYPLINSELSNGSNGSSVAASNVVDGYALLQASKTKSYPYDVNDLPDPSSSEGKAIIQEVEKMADAMDAISDLALSESVYQIIQGNYERGGSILKSYSEGKNPPAPQIADTPRQGGTLTNRIAVNFEIEPSDNLWGTTMSPKARTEKGLNKWLAAVIGDPDKIRCVITSTYTDATGNETTAISVVKLSELDLQPIDFVLMTDKTFGKGSSELEKRLAYLFRRSKNIPDSETIEIQFKDRDAGWDESIKTFFEMIPFIKNLREIITLCRPLQALDLMVPAEAQSTTSSNMKGYDTDDIKNSSATGRLDTAYAELETRKNELSTAMSAVTDPYTSSSFDLLRDKLKAIADYGVTGAFPVSATGFTSTEYDLLKTQTDSVLSLIEQRLEDARELLDYTPSAGSLSDNPTDAEVMQDESRKKDELISKYSSAAKLLLGSSFTLIPKFALNNADEISNVLSNSTNLIRYSTNDLGNPFIVDDWIQGVATVRKRTANFDGVMMYNQNINNAYITLTPMQLPYDASHHWAAVEFPAEMEVDKDIVSIVTQLPATYSVAGEQSGLLIDDWTELIPEKSGMTGIAFHYDQPNAMPPQTLLLAITPQIKGHWTWQDLMDTLNDTLDRAKRRAVEPDHIDDSVYAQFLPAIVTAFSYYPVTVSTYLAQNILGKTI